MTEIELGDLLVQLRDAGERLKGTSRHTLDGIATKAAIYEDIRAWTPEAIRLGASVKTIYETLGMSRTMLDNIRTGKVKIAQGRSADAAGVAEQLRVLAEWIRDPSDDTRPPVETADVLDRAVALLGR